MIKSITGVGDLINVNGGYASAPMYIDNYKLQQGIAGQVRYNGNDFEVNDGSGWKQIMSNYATVESTPQAKDAFQWVVRQMAKEREIEELAKTSESVAGALEEYKAIVALAQERLNLIVTLAKEHT
jgi:hypothetical protein